MYLAQDEKERTNQHSHEQDGCKRTKAMSPQPCPGTGGARLLSLPGARTVLSPGERYVVSLYTLMLVHSAVTICQQAMAYTGEMLSRLRLCAVHLTKIADETPISLTRLFRKQLIKVCHNALPFYCLS
jgi:hypothetical protein